MHHDSRQSCRPTTPPQIAVFLFEPGGGGLDRVAILLANGFAARGIRTELWLTRTQGPSRFLVEDNVVVRMVPTPYSRKRGLALALQIPALTRMIARHRPTVLLSAGNQSNLTMSIATRLARGGHTAAIQKITNPIARPGVRGRFQFLRDWRFGLTARLGHKILTLSDVDARTYARAYPAAASKFVMAPLPCVTDEMLAIGRSRRAPQKGAVPQFLSVARLDVQKDHTTMLSALALLAARPWHLTLVGDGPLKAMLVQQAEVLGIADRLTFAGFVREPESYYADADLLILSSRWEGLGAVVLEAFACGCAVVATDCAPGLTALLDAAGLSKPVPVGDPEALSKAIVAALDSPPNLSRVRAIAATYSLEASIDDHLRLFTPWLSDSSKPELLATDAGK